MSSPALPSNTAQKPALPPHANGMAQSHTPIPPTVEMKLDTTTPMVKPGAVSAFVSADLQRYAPWLQKKLVERWPAISAMTFSGWIMGWIGSNTYHFVKTDHAVGLFEVFRETPELSNKARAVFVFCENSKDEAHQEEMLAIYRHSKAWGRSIGVHEIRNIEGASDLPPTRLRNNAAAVSKNGLMFQL